MGKLQINGGLKVQGRVNGSGDDEGIVIDYADNNWAGLILGSPSAKRSAFYLSSSGLPRWRYNDGSNSYDITHPSKAGTIALTSDIPTTMAWSNITGKPSTFTPSSHTHSYLPLTGGTLTGNLTLTETKNILLRPNNSSYTAGIGYDTSGNECIALWAKNSVTRLRWYAGTDMSNMAAGTMMNITPDFEISKASGTAIGYIGGNTILHSNNYTSYTVTKTGSGASGTWGINITGSAGYATYAQSVYGTYTGNGGNQVPSYIGANRTKFNMMRNFGSSDIGGYMDCILMNNYGWNDVPYATGLGITKTNGYPRAIIANGPQDKWAYTTELLTSYNYSWWALPLSGGTMTGKLQVNNIIFGYNYTNSNNAAAFMFDKPSSNYTGIGACGQNDMIHFGPCNASGAWVSNYNQIWRFQGGVYATGWLETDNYGTGDPGTGTGGYGRGGAIYFKVIG